MYAYLFAIQHRAKKIYDVDERGIITDGKNVKEQINKHTFINKLILTI